MSGRAARRGMARTTRATERGALGNKVGVRVGASRAGRSSSPGSSNPSDQIPRIDLTSFVARRGPGSSPLRLRCSRAAGPGRDPRRLQSARDTVDRSTLFEAVSCRPRRSAGQERSDELQRGGRSSSFPRAAVLFIEVEARPTGRANVRTRAIVRKRATARASRRTRRRSRASGRDAAGSPRPRPSRIRASTGSSRARTSRFRCRRSRRRCGAREKWERSSGSRSSSTAISGTAMSTPRSS